jgi:hypothetical protein
LKRTDRLAIVVLGTLAFLTAVSPADACCFGGLFGRRHRATYAVAVCPVVVNRPHLASPPAYVVVRRTQNVLSGRPAYSAPSCGPYGCPAPVPVPYGTVTFGSGYSSPGR